MALSLSHLAGLATTAAAPAPAPPAALTFALGGSILGEPLGLLVLDLGFAFSIEGLVVVVSLISCGRRSGGRLRREQRLGGVERMHLLAVVDDVGLLAADGRIRNHRQRDLEAVLEIAQVTALVVEHIERDVGAGAHHE